MEGLKRQLLQNGSIQWNCRPYWLKLAMYGGLWLEHCSWMMSHLLGVKFYRIESFVRDVLYRKQCMFWIYLWIYMHWLKFIFLILLGDSMMSFWPVTFKHSAFLSTLFRDSFAIHNTVVSRFCSSSRRCLGCPFLTFKARHHFSEMSMWFCWSYSETSWSKKQFQSSRNTRACSRAHSISIPCNSAPKITHRTNNATSMEASR